MKSSFCVFFVIIASIEIESVSVSLVHKATDRLFLCGITSKDICNSQSVCFGQSVSFEHKTTDHLFLCGITSKNIYSQSLFLWVSLCLFCS